MRRLGLVCCAVVLVVLAIAGCGGGGGGESTAAAAGETTESAALSKEELLAQGDAICAEVNAAVGTVGSTSSGAAGAGRADRPHRGVDLGADRIPLREQLFLAQCRTFGRFDRRSGRRLAPPAAATTGDREDNKHNCAANKP